MKKFIFIFSIAALSVVSLIACGKDSLSDNQPISEKSTLTKDVIYKDILENLNYFTALYENGDTMTLFLSEGKVDQTLNKVKKDFQNQVLSVGKHDYTTKNKIKFARWCDKQLKAGHTLTIGYNKETGTYWGDINK